MAEQALKGLISLDASNGEPIKIIINTCGGEEWDGMAIYDAIRSCRSDVIGLVYGQASSMGSVILQACFERVLAPHSVLMIHSGTLALEDRVENVENYVAFNKRYTELTNKIYLDKIRQVKHRFTKKQLQQLLEKDSYFMAREAIALGLADKILGE